MLTLETCFLILVLKVFPFEYDTSCMSSLMRKYDEPIHHGETSPIQLFRISFDSFFSILIPNQSTMQHAPPYKNPLKTKVTRVKEIPFFVTDKFLRTYARDRYQLSQVERMVEKSYKNYLVNECNNQKVYKKSLERQAMHTHGTTEADRQRMSRKAQEFELSRCIELQELFL